MNTAFEPMSPDEQIRFREAYLRYLRARDGVPDLETQRFDVREKFFAQVDANPNLWVGGALPVDHRVFDRNHARAAPEPGLNEATLWALAVAKTNRAERYGVERSLALQKPRDARNDPHAYIQIEEFYHTRILRDALATIGLHVDVGMPSVSTRALVTAMVRLPRRYADVLVLCGEIFGVAAFSMLLEKARALFAHQPKVMARMEVLFGQIMVDEVGHVHYVRSCLGPDALEWAKRMMPLVAWGALRDLPELDSLFGREAIMERVRTADVDAAAASYPDRFIHQAA
jgi:hypothetical protein